MTCLARFICLCWLEDMLWSKATRFLMDLQMADLQSWGVTSTRHINFKYLFLPDLPQSVHLIKLLFCGGVTSNSTPTINLKWSGCEIEKGEKRTLEGFKNDWVVLVRDTCWPVQASRETRTPFEVNWSIVRRQGWRVMWRCVVTG